MGQRLLDHLCAELPATAEPAVVQLWPEHFDLGTHVTLAGGDHANLGASPGDGFSDDPYLYVAPWSDARPGDPGYWNAPFGAVRRRDELVVTGTAGAAAARDEQDEEEARWFAVGLQFFTSGLEMFGFAPHVGTEER